MVGVWHVACFAKVRLRLTTDQTEGGVMECHQDHGSLQHNRGPGQLRNNALRVLSTVSILVVGYYIWSEHRAHLIGALPYLVVLLCPLMHLFMMGHHGGHAHESGRSDSGNGSASPRSQTAQT